MAEYTNNTYVNFDIDTDLGIGVYLPSVFRVSTIENNGYDLSSSFNVSLESLSVDDILVEATLSGTFKYIDDDSIIDMELSDLTITTPFDIPLNFCTISSTINKDIDYVTSYKVLNTNTDTENVTTHLYISNNKSQISDIIDTFFIYIGNVNITNDTQIDLYLSNNRYYCYHTDQFATNIDLVSFGVDFENGMGRSVNIPTDIFSASGITYSGTVLDTYSTISNVYGYSSEMTTISGGQAYTVADCYSSAIVVSGTVNYDIRTWSLEFGDFFADYGSITTASSIAWIEIIDGLGEVDTNNCYFSIDDQQVISTFVPINNGYRMEYNPSNDYAYLDSFKLSVHAQNYYNDVLEIDYRFFYGADIKLNEVMDLGSKRSISVWSKATNLMNCPEFSTISYNFETQKRLHSDLNISILPVSYVDLPVTLYPQNTFFFYGRTYNVIISGLKDVSGNVTPEYTHTFTIENPLT